jgi:dihydrodipicolinate synthase/N-acetylneuraminate lyase
MTERIHGIFAPLMVPLDDQGEINEPELCRLVDWLIERGAHGLYPNGSTSEFVRFNEEERRRIIRIVCRQTAGRVPILAGAAEANTRETLEACKEYKDLGVRAAAVVAPYYYRLSQESVYAYYRELAQNSPIDLVLYNIPAFSNPIEPATVARLAEFERIVAIKDSSGDIASLLRMIAAVRPKRPDFAFLTGSEHALVPMLLVGADGGTHASANVVPELLRRAFDLTRAGEVKKALDLQLRLLGLLDFLMTAGDFPEGFRAGLEARGFRMGASRQPHTAAQAIDRGRLSGLLDPLLADFAAGRWDK